MSTKRTRSELARPGESALSVDHAELLEDVAEYAEAADAENTQLAFASDWRHFEAWCVRQTLPPFPAAPAAIAAYIAALAKGKTDDLGPRKAATIRRRLTSISARHRRAGVDDPTKDGRVKLVWRGIRKRLGVKSNGKAPLLREQVRQCARTEPDTWAGIRNRALLLYGFESAQRRCEISTMRIEDLRFGKRGVIYTFPRSKANQEGELEWIGIPRDPDVTVCPVAALERWLAVTGTTAGYIFPNARDPGRPINARTVARVVKAAAKRAGLDERRFAAHSLRHGYVTSETDDGASDTAIKGRTRHKSSAMLDVYRSMQAPEKWMEE